MQERNWENSVWTQVQHRLPKNSVYCPPTDVFKSEPHGQLSEMLANITDKLLPKLNPLEITAGQYTYHEKSPQ